jgi:hypothetical protein
MVAAVASASIVVVDAAIGSGDWLHSVAENGGALSGVDVVAAAAALVFACGALIVDRRAKRGATTGVWAAHSNETV